MHQIRTQGGGAGTGQHGAMPFGTGRLTPISLLSARAISANRAEVCFSGDIGIPNPCDPNDPTNRRTWGLVPSRPGVCVRLVQALEVTSTEDGGCYLLSFDGVLCCGEVYTITNSVVSPLADSVTFTAICVDKSAKPKAAWESDGFMRDIANPQLEKDALMSGPFLALGTYEITDTGDLAQDSGVASYRKRVIRRATTAVGGFFHLGQYGTELELKRLIRPDLLRRVQDKVRAQVMREPETADARVTISQPVSAQNVLIVRIQARTAASQQIEISTIVSI